MAGQSTTILSCKDMPGQRVWVGRIRFVADDTTHLFAPITTKDINGFIVRIAYIPGATSPSNGTDVTLKDANGYDAAEGGFVNMDGIVHTMVPANEPYYVVGPLTIDAVQNTTDSATFDIEIVYQR